jgi:molybdopterin/thiamine biosynthesis adenylyltransferase
VEDELRLADERSRMEAHGFAFDENALAKRNRVEFTGVINDGVGDVAVRVICLDGFPYRIPVFVASELELTPTTRHIAFRTRSICLRTIKPQDWQHTEHVADLIPDAERILRGQHTGNFGEEHVVSDQDLFGTRSAARHVVIPNDLVTPPNTPLFKLDWFWRFSPKTLFVYSVDDSESQLIAKPISAKYEGVWVFKLREMPFQTIEACNDLFEKPSPQFFEMLRDYAVDPDAALKKLLHLAKPKHLPCVFGVTFPYQDRWFWQFVSLDSINAHSSEWSLLGTSNLDTFASRLTGVLDLDALKQKSVVVAGCGAIGSTIAVELACAGIGKLFLNDSDFVSVANVGRHECSLANLGTAKSEALRIKIGLKNPLTEIVSAGDIFSDPDFESKVEQSDLVICGIGDYNIEAYINKLCVRLEKAAVFAYIGVYGVMGHVIRINTKGRRTGCMECFERYLKHGGIPALPVINDPNVTIVEMGCNNPSLPATSFDQRTIALIAARKSIQFLNPEMYEDDGADVIVFYARWLTGVSEEESLKTVKSPLPALEDCPVCGGDAHR